MKLKHVVLLMGLVILSGCKNNKTVQPVRPPDKADETAAVKTAYQQFVRAQRACDRQKLKSLIAPRTWAALIKVRTKAGDMVDILCKRAHSGKIVFQDVAVDNDRATLSVKIGNQPAAEVRMVKMGGQWMVGEPGKPKNKGTGALIKPVKIKQQASPHHRFQITNVHIGPRLTTGPGETKPRHAQEKKEKAQK